MNPKLLFILAAASFLAACNDKKEESLTEAKKEVKRHVNSDALIIGNPMDCGIDNMLLFPVGANYSAQVFENNPQDVLNRQLANGKELSFTVNASSTLYDRNATTEYINPMEDVFDIRNILFYSLTTGKSYPLVTDSIHILSFALHKELPKPMIFYRVVKRDFNADTLYNSQDPVLLFVSDLSGKGFTQITPDNEQFLNYFYYSKSQTLLIKTAIDSDKDSTFTNNDETNFREVVITNPSMGREIFSRTLKDSLR